MTATTVRTSPDVLVQQIGEEAVLLDLSSGTYFGLDPLGARIWSLLADGSSIADLTNILLQEYDVPRKVLERDLDKLLAELQAHGLVHPSP